MKNTTGNHLFFAMIALFIIPISGLSIDIYVPSLPALKQYFGVDQNLIQLSITVYMLGLGVMQLFAGSVSDSFGRRNPALIALSIYAITSLAISLVTNIYLFLVLRFIQGFMVAMLVVPMRSVIPDLFTGKQLHRMTSYMTLAWSIGPIIAPAIGGYLQQYLGWQANFKFLTFYSLIAFLLVWRFLPETSLYRHPFRGKEMINRYQEIVKNWHFSKAVMIDGLLYSLIIIFSVIAPFLIQNTLHYQAAQFGHIALLIGVAWLMGSIINRLTLEMSPETKIKTCLYAMLAIATTMVIGAIYLPLSIVSIICPIFLIITLGGIIFPTYFTTCISLFPKMTGSANALFGSLVFSISGLMTIVASSLHANILLPMAISYCLVIGLCLAIYAIPALSQQEIKDEMIAETSH